MTFYVENDVDAKFDFDINETAKKVICQAVKQEKCPYEVEVNIQITDNKGIHEYNRTYRKIDSPTDVLSFPNVDYENPADFSLVEEHEADYIDPETGELFLGDIILSEDKIRKQALEYGHGTLREFSFLIAHSMLHLFGYDHMTVEDAALMEAKQEEILQALSIER